MPRAVLKKVNRVKKSKDIAMIRVEFVTDVSIKESLKILGKLELKELNIQGLNSDYRPVDDEYIDLEKDLDKVM